MASSHQSEIPSDAPLPRIRARHNARDITEEFSRASKALNTGQLVKDETFTLFESVQALEIMDPKMDSGYLRPGEALHDRYDVCQELQPSQVIGIIDKMLCYEMCWHRGYSLAQNLFTSHYLEHLLSQERLQGAMPHFLPRPNGQEPGPLVQLVLRAYCIGAIKSCDIVVETVLSQHYYEEEDFNTNPFGREFLVDVADEQCQKLLIDAVNWLRTSSDISSPFKEALISRMRIREDFFNTSLSGVPGEGHNFDWQGVKSRIKHVQETHELGILHSDAFSAKIQRKLASTVPPRPIVELDFAAACTDLTQLYDDLEYMLRVQQLPPQSSLENLTNVLWSVALREPQPSTFARAILQRLVLAEGAIAGPGGIQRLLGHELQEHLPAEYYLTDAFWDVELPTDPRHKIARDVDFFVEQGGIEYANIIRSLCQNRSRIRRCLVNVVSEFDNFQESLYLRWPRLQTQTTKAALEEPEHYIPQTITHVANCTKLRITEWIILLGFDHDLYEDYELATMYWYLSATASHRQRLLDETTSTLLTLTTPRPPHHHPKKSWQANMYEARDAHGLKADTLMQRAKLAKVTADMALGLSYTYASLRALNLLTSTATTYTTPALQFALRTRPFTRLRHPPPPAYADLPAYLVSLEAGELLRSARTHLQAPKAALMALLRDSRLLVAQGGNRAAVALAEKHACVLCEAEWREGLSKSLRAVVRAGVVVEGLLGRVTAVEAGVVGVKVPGMEDGERDHVWWIVPIVKDK